MIKLFISAAKDMDDVFWMQAYGNKDALLDSIESPQLKQFAKINYGPWDRLKNNRPFLDGVTTKPAGANFYPSDITKEEIEAFIAKNPEKTKEIQSLYTLVDRDENGNLVTAPYSFAFKKPFSNAAAKLRKAASLAEDAGFKAYLNARATALLTDNYRPSDMLWMDMKNQRT